MPLKHTASANTFKCITHVELLVRLGNDAVVNQYLAEKLSMTQSETSKTALRLTETTATLTTTAAALACGRANNR